MRRAALLRLQSDGSPLELAILIERYRHRTEIITYLQRKCHGSCQVERAKVDSLDLDCEFAGRLDYDLQVFSIVLLASRT